MNQSLEKFIQSNRDAFDTEDPSPELWNNLRKEMHRPLRRNLFAKSWLIAASTVTIAGLIVFLFIGNGSDPVNTKLVVQPVDKSNELLHEINPSYAKEVNHFTQLIELKQIELKKLQQTDPVVYQQFLGDITRLDNSYNALKKELPENPNREQLLEAMIQNLRLQTELLNEQLVIIQKIKQSKNKYNETNSKSI